MNTNQETPILMPKLGNQMEEGTITRWLVSPGDSISKGQIIFELETDKANVDVESDYSGKLIRIVIGDNESSKVGEPIAYIES